MSITTDELKLPTDDGPMPALRWTPGRGRGPGIVLLHEIFGVTPYIRRRAEDLAALGYVVLVPQIYWRLGVEEVLEGPQALQEGIALVQELDWPAAVGDTVLALESMRSRPKVAASGKVGIVGFCFGGGLGFNVAAEEYGDCLVSYYGSAIPGLIDVLPAVTVPSLHHFGLADVYIDKKTVERIRGIVTEQPACEFYTYEGADHAFDNPDFGSHHPAASAVAWGRTVDFLQRVLPTE